MNSAICLLEQTAQRLPGNTAFRDNDTTLSYVELRVMARAIGSAVAARTKQDERTPVIIALPKNATTAAALLGVLYSGNPYVPIDPDTPVPRFEAIREVLGESLVITDAANKARLGDGAADALLIDEIVATAVDDAELDCRVDRVMDCDPAYIMFTSGSTGVPKGVAVPHRAVIDYANWVVETFDCDEQSVFGNQAAFYFANSIYDIYGVLRCGGTLHIIPPVLFTFPSKLPAYLTEQGVSHILWVPTVMKNIANSGVLDKVELPTLRLICFCGEILAASYLNVWRAHLPDTRFANLYGMTEGADAVSYHLIERDYGDHEAIPIGHACRNTRVQVLDTYGNECPTGEVGEICVMGTCLALGYYNRHDLTEQVFVNNPCEPRFQEKMYRTGDLGFKGEDGLYYIKGRTDSQVKVKGNRIELGEVEKAAATLQSQGAENVCVLFDQEAEEIVLFLQTTQDFKLRKINQHLKTIIPDYMLPARLELCKQFPLTASGKIDRMHLRKTHNLI